MKFKTKISDNIATALQEEVQQNPIKIALLLLPGPIPEEIEAELLKIAECSILTIFPAGKRRRAQSLDVENSQRELVV